MFESSLARTRRRVGLGLSVLLGSWVLWMLTPGIPVLRAPQASAAVREAGLTLFEHEWKPGDSLAGRRWSGAGIQRAIVRGLPLPGGSRGWGRLAQHNVASFEVHPAPGRPEVEGGVIHSFAISKECRESPTGLHDFFPVVPGGLKIVGGCFSGDAGFRPGAHPERQPDGLVRGGLDRPDLDARASCTRAGNGRCRRSARSSRPIWTPSSRAGRACCPTAGSASSAGRRSSPRWRSSSPPPAPTSSGWATR